jgi:hypothetical protein
VGLGSSIRRVDHHSGRQSFGGSRSALESAPEAEKISRTGDF